MKKVLGVLVIIGIGILVYSQYKKSKKEIKKVKIKK